MKPIEVLKTRLLNNKLMIQNEDGFTAEVEFEWNPPINDEEISKFELETGFTLPDSYKRFLKVSNGATLFKDTKYGQWGCVLLGLNDMRLVTNEVKDRGYELDNLWVVFATWLGDGDVLVFDLSKYKSGERDYILDGDQGYQTDEWEYIKDDFAKWVDRLIVAQGAKYWRWY
jgi:hypothetical protein